MLDAIAQFEQAPGRAEADELATALEQELWEVETALDPAASGSADGERPGGARGGAKTALEVVGS